MQNSKQALSRREFIRETSFAGIALTIGAYLPLNAKNTFEIVNVHNTENKGKELMSWISIAKSGKVTIMSNRSEMGQGTFQVLPQIIAEELEVDLDQVNILFAPANPKKFGPQPQEGSFSVRGWYKQLLQVGASAREMLIESASRRWNVPVSECFAENGRVIHRPSGKKLGYGELVEEAAALTPPQNIILKERKDYKIIGKSLLRQDIPLKTNGSAIFGLEKKLPGMLQGRKVLKVEWDDDGFEHPDSDEISKQMLKNLKKPGLSEKFENAYKNTVKKIEAIYETPYQSHSCMEPLNCIAHVQENSIEIWGPIQEANWTQADLSERMRIPIENVTVNMTFLGGGFGRKAFTDYPHEAALISKTMKAPVQVIWTREDDMSLGRFVLVPLTHVKEELTKTEIFLHFKR